MAEKETSSYFKIRQIQTRVRQKGGGQANALPAEDEQFLVWLDGIDDYFFVPLKTAGNLAMETELMALLREAFMHNKKVKLAYQEAWGNQYISAAWAQH
jgi:hypothetical protein